MSTTFEDLLARDGFVVYKTHGVSMEPMLRQNRDLVIIQAPASRLRKYDLALYKRGETYVLHRVVEVKADHYRILGDNTYTVENVPEEAVIGVLTSFQRKGKQYKVTDNRYQIYVRFWFTIFPLRAFYVCCRRAAIVGARRMGILPLIKAILRK